MPSMPEADAEGTLVMYSNVLPGTTAYAMVETRNFTLKGSGKFRREFFGVQVDPWRHLATHRPQRPLHPDLINLIGRRTSPRPCCKAAPTALSLSSGLKMRYFDPCEHSCTCGREFMCAVARQIPSRSLQVKQARMRLNPSYNSITVTDPLSYTEWFGTSCGMYAALLR